MLQFIDNNEYNKIVADLYKTGYMSKGRKILPEKALSIFIIADLSIFQYIIIRNEARKQNSNPWPPYFKLLAEKRNCCPPTARINITEISAKIGLQSL